MLPTYKVKFPGNHGRGQGSFPVRARRTFAQNLAFKLFKTIFADCFRIFNIQEMYLLLIFAEFSTLFFFLLFWFFKKNARGNVVPLPLPAPIPEICCSELTFPVVETERLFQFFLHGLRILFLEEVRRDATETVEVDLSGSWLKTQIALDSQSTVAGAG